MKCGEVQEILALYDDRESDKDPVVEAHLSDCPDCREALSEYRLIRNLLKEKKVEMPADLTERIHCALEREPKPNKKNWFSLPSIGIGAAVAAAALIALLRLGTPLPVIQTAAVSQGQNVAVQIGFDVTEDVRDVTFQIDLPKGLQFVDAKGQPVSARTVSWQGELKTGKTVVPVTVRGIQPGKWEILATIRKNQMARETKIILPVESKVLHRTTNPLG
ncbi:MAG TPA: hypothetical protein DD435_03685 [Cyanobacteria bacterium UBA8530]|nr:hypothetical protein [Cyanobacteria bacterium UBA8530]